MTMWDDDWDGDFSEAERRMLAERMNSLSFPSPYLLRRDKAGELWTPSEMGLAYERFADACERSRTYSKYFDDTSRAKPEKKTKTMPFRWRVAAILPAVPLAVSVGLFVGGFTMPAVILFFVGLIGYIIVGGLAAG